MQPPQLPTPEGPRNVSITIPTGPRGTAGDPNKIFDLFGLDQRPEPRYQAKPVYPFDMRRTGSSGQVLVGFVVDASGSVQGAYAVSSTQREFESAAVQAVSKWKFKAGRKDGRAVSTRMQVPVVFSVNEEQE